MTTTPVDGTDVSVADPVASPEPVVQDTLIHTDAVTPTETPPAAETTPNPAPSTSDAASEPEPEKSPEAQAEEPTYDDNGQPTNSAAWAKKFNNQESALQQKIREGTERAEAAEKQAALLSQQTEHDAFANRVVSERDQRKAFLVENGMDDALALETANAEARPKVEAYVARYEGGAARSQLEQITAERDDIAAKSSVDNLMREHAVPEHQRALLAATTNATAAVELATALGTAEKLRVENESLKQAQVPATGEEQQVDSGSGEGSMTDAQIVRAMGLGTFNDLGAGEAAMKRQGLL
jgi:hypothetical protein|tara:strand:+ start:567 stop:1457 length:891 start_codon:yes stop_codon:yes gene_type:complete